ncbi:putative toxin component of ESAT-related protein [Bacillus atrophaeus UCMB-5137]|nr:putative toxin component of ESAT-related protein [Bacillus atrophaeus UCMB-5137]
MEKQICNLSINLHHLIQEEPGSMVEIPASIHKNNSKVPPWIKKGWRKF